MPSLFHVGAYTIYFWSNENNEPIRVHVSKGVPTNNATKLWLTKDGGCFLASNVGHIPQKDLNKIEDIIAAEFLIICAKWKTFFNTDTIRFYC